MDYFFSQQPTRKSIVSNGSFNLIPDAPQFDSQFYSSQKNTDYHSQRLYESTYNKENIGLFSSPDRSNELSDYSHMFPNSLNNGHHFQPTNKFPNLHEEKWIKPTNQSLLSNVFSKSQQQSKWNFPKTPGRIFHDGKEKSNFNTTQPMIPPETPANEKHPVAEIEGSRITLKSVHEIPEKFRSIFPFAYFNALQTQVFDEVMYSDNPLVICSPTGSGKTVLFELSITRLLLRNNRFEYKIVYMAPIKALCSERFQDWNRKFSLFDLKCTELTGDTDLDDFQELQFSHIVFTTPEKWDSMTRKWKDHKSLVQSVRLFLIDEVHLLNDSSRGATMEAVVSRMKTVQVAINNESTTSDTPVMRFMAISATIPNVKDIASWLDTGILPSVGLSFGEEFRPVALRKIVLGYPFSDKQTDFKFDLTLNYKLSNVIQTYSENKPSLVFCCTRKSVTQAAGVLIKDARFIMNPQHKKRLTQYANMIHDAKLQDYVIYGVGFHHAGLDVSDRKNIEEMFTQGDLPVLFCTSTLAMGVNLPAHLVVIKGTMHYSMNSYVEYSEAQILQMMGRAGRPQFDVSASAVIMTKHQTKAKYQAMVSGTQNIESSLHHHLTEHINAEIVLGTIRDTKVAGEWLKSTFLYRRMKENPKHYGAPEGLDKIALGNRLQAMCSRALKLLQSYGLVNLNEDSSLLPTELGKLMARYCIAFDTVKTLSAATGNESMEQLIALFSQSKEFDDITIRQNEKRILNTLNKDKHRITIRYPLNSKIKTTDMKINCLLQAALGCLSVNEFSLTQDTAKIFRIGQRLSRFMMEFFVQQDCFQAALNAVTLCQCIKSKLWENSKFIARQLERIGPSLSSALVNAGITTFKKIEETNPRELEMIMNRHPPFGSQVKEAVAGLPKLDVSVEQASNYQSASADIFLTVQLLNCAERAVYLAGKKAYMQGYMLDGSLVSSGKWSRKLSIPRTSKSPQLSIHMVCLDYVGLDVQRCFTPTYIGHASIPQEVLKFPYYPQYNDAEIKSIPFTCEHKCINKKCGHECCNKSLPRVNEEHFIEESADDKKRKTSKHKTTQLTDVTPDYKASPMVRFCDDINRRKSNLPNVQPLKKIKVELTLHTGTSRNTHDKSGATRDLHQYEYKPRKLNFNRLDRSNDSINTSTGGILSQVTRFQKLHTPNYPDVSKSMILGDSQIHHSTTSLDEDMYDFWEDADHNSEDYDGKTSPPKVLHDHLKNEITLNNDFHVDFNTSNPSTDWKKYSGIANTFQTYGKSKTFEASRDITPANAENSSNQRHDRLFDRSREKDVEMLGGDIKCAKQLEDKINKINHGSSFMLSTKGHKSNPFNFTTDDVENDGCFDLHQERVVPLTSHRVRERPRYYDRNSSRRDHSDMKPNPIFFCETSQNTLTNLSKNKENGLLSNVVLSDEDDDLPIVPIYNTEKFPKTGKTKTCKTSNDRKNICSDRYGRYEEEKLKDIGLKKTATLTSYPPKCDDNPSPVASLPIRTLNWQSSIFDDFQEDNNDYEFYDQRETKSHVVRPQILLIRRFSGGRLDLPVEPA